MISTKCVAVITALLLLAVPLTARAGELAGAVNVRNGIVHVEVEDEGKPAVGVKVRLQETHKKEVVAKGKINAEGEWSWPLLKAGSYEVVIESEKGPLVWPVDQREKVDPSEEGKKCAHCPAPPELPGKNLGSSLSPLPWIEGAVLATGLLGGCGLVLWFRKKRR